jgi:hypothetical protein
MKQKILVYVIILSFSGILFQIPNNVSASDIHVW